jgi:hypothetical protein
MICVGGESEGDEAAFCLVAVDLAMDSDEEVRQARSEVAKALTREATAKQRRDQLQRERDAMVAAMKRAMAMLPVESAQEIRQVYRKAML